MDLQTVSKAIAIHSSTIDLGNAFRELAERSILRTTIKYFGRLNTASVNVSRDGTLFHCAVEIVKLKRSFLRFPGVRTGVFNASK